MKSALKSVKKNAKIYTEAKHQALDDDALTVRFELFATAEMKNIVRDLDREIKQLTENIQNASSLDDAESLESKLLQIEPSLANRVINQAKRELMAVQASMHDMGAPINNNQSAIAFMAAHCLLKSRKEPYLRRPPTMLESDGEPPRQAPTMIQQLSNHIHVWEVPASKGKSRMIAAAAFFLQQMLKNEIKRVVIYFPSPLVLSKDQPMYDVMRE